MTAATLSIQIPNRVAAPRGARAVGWLVDLAVAWRRQRDRAEAARARARLQRDAIAITRLAARLRHSDPGQAADLLAAVDRTLTD